jgi:hypothetical protein
MSDHYYASIRIGGSLPREQIPRLCVLLGLDGEDSETLLRRVEQGWLRHEDGEAAWGEFDSLQRACRDLGLAYARDSDAYFDTPARTAFWQPGMEAPKSVVTDGDGTQLVDADVLSEVRDLLLAGRTGEALQSLENAIVVVPEIPPFTIGAKAPA